MQHKRLYTTLSENMKQVTYINPCIDMKWTTWGKSFKIFRTRKTTQHGFSPDDIPLQWYEVEELDKTCSHSGPTLKLQSRLSVWAINPFFTMWGNDSNYVEWEKLLSLGLIPSDGENFLVNKRYNKATLLVPLRRTILVLGGKYLKTNCLGGT